MTRPRCLTYEPLPLPPPGGAESLVLDLRMQEQLAPEWCWAAVAASLHDFYAKPGSPTRQCSVVNTVLTPTTRGGADACTVPVPSSCNKPWSLTPALDALSVGRDEVAGEALLGDLVAQLAAGRPVCVLLSWHYTTEHPSGGGHFVVLHGYGPSSGGAPRFVAIGDPLYGSTVMDLADFPTSYHGGAVWAQTCLTSADSPYTPVAEGAAS